MIDEKNMIMLEAMRNSNIISSRILSEGRMNSYCDEKTICDYLITNDLTKNFISIENRRMAGDFLVKDNILIPYNIKTTFGSTSDNAFSKKGVVYSLTSLLYNEIPNALSWDKMYELIKKYKAENNKDKDYYYFVCDKRDMSKCFIRGLRQINNLKSNPSNTFQVNWKEEALLQPSTRTFDESYGYIIGIIKEAIDKDTKGKLAFRNGL